MMKPERQPRTQSDLRSQPCWRMLSRSTLGLALCAAACELDAVSVWPRSSGVATCFICSATKALCETGMRSRFPSSFSTRALSSPSGPLSVGEALDPFPEVCSTERKDECQLHRWHFGSDAYPLKNRPFIVAAVEWTHSESYLANLTMTQGSYLLETKVY